MSDDEPVHCCVICPYREQKGGAELSFLHLLRHGRDRGVGWSAAFFDDGPMAREARDLGVPTATLGLTRRLADPLRLPAALYRLRRFLKRHRADLTLGWIAHAGHLAGTAAYLTGTPAAWFQKGGCERPTWKTRPLIDSPARAILANSLPTALRQHAAMPHKPVIVVPSGVDLSRFDPAPLGTPAQNRRRLGLPQRGPILCLPGRLQRWKGQLTLIRAMPLVRQRHPDAVVLFVGGPHPTEPDYPDELRAEATRLDAGAIFAGAVPHEDVPRHLQASDVVVNASDHEPFGITVIEGMALGKPTIATNRGGPTQVVTPGLDGTLVEPDRPDALAGAILAYLDDPALAARAGAAARGRAAGFSVDAFAGRMARAVRQIARGPLPPPGVWFDGQQHA